MQNTHTQEKNENDGGVFQWIENFSLFIERFGESKILHLNMPRHAAVIKEVSMEIVGFSPKQKITNPTNLKPSTELHANAVTPNVNTIDPSATHGVLSKNVILYANLSFANEISPFCVLSCGKLNKINHANWYRPNHTISGKLVVVKLSALSSQGDILSVIASESKVNIVLSIIFESCKEG